MALREGLTDGTIDIVATDHAPHPTEAKECEWQSAAFGMIGLESALSVVMQTMVETSMIKWVDIVDRMSTAPARIGGYAEQGRGLGVGAPANIALFDITRSWRVDRDLVASRSRNTPFHGMELPGVVRLTMLRGKISFESGSSQ